MCRECLGDEPPHTRGRHRHCTAAMGRWGREPSNREGAEAALAALGGESGPFCVRPHKDKAKREFCVPSLDMHWTECHAPTTVPPPSPPLVGTTVHTHALVERVILYAYSGTGACMFCLICCRLAIKKHVQGCYAISSLPSLSVLLSSTAANNTTLLFTCDLPWLRPAVESSVRFTVTYAIASGRHESR